MHRGRPALQTITCLCFTLLLHAVKAATVVGGIIESGPPLLSDRRAAWLETIKFRETF